MVRFYQMLAAADGRMRVPHVVRPGSDATAVVDISPEQLQGLRDAMVSVVERGTARASRVQNLAIAGKTATAQNAHGPDHGWFIGFAPAQKPEIVVGAIVEFAEHGSAVAPMVSRIIARFLGADTVAAAQIRRFLPADSAPESARLLPTRDTTRLNPSDTLMDTTIVPIPQR